MLRVRSARDRGHFDHGWLDTYHTFSFGAYRDPEQMGFRALRVINEDRVAPGQGFGTHGHRDMEIVSYVLAGALEHRDSMGNGSVLQAGEFQRMSAGRGIQHSEFNPSREETAHFYQIWLLPAEQGVEPSYEQRRFPDPLLDNRWGLVAAPQGVDGALAIGQDVRIYLARLAAGRQLDLPDAGERHAWLQVLRGQVKLEAHTLQAGDGVAISNHPASLLVAESEAELMLFDLA